MAFHVVVPINGYGPNDVRWVSEKIWPLYPPVVDRDGNVQDGVKITSGTIVKSIGIVDSFGKMPDIPVTSQLLPEAPLQLSPEANINDKVEDQIKRGPGRPRKE